MYNSLQRHSTSGGGGGLASSSSRSKTSDAIDVDYDNVDDCIGIIGRGEIRIFYSGQPKGLSFGFQPKFSVSVGAETFRQNFPFGRKTSYGRNAQFRPKYCYFGRNITALSAERGPFRPKEDTFGRNSPLSAVSAFGLN